MRLLRLMAGLTVLAASGAGVWYLYRPPETRQLRQENQELLRQRRELEGMVERLASEQRIAEIHVIDQVRPGELINGVPAPSVVTILEFIEIDRQGNTLPGKRFQIHDSLIFFDALVIQFDPDHVAAGDALRGKSLALFRRIFGEHQKPVDGYAIDPAGQIPDVYRVNPLPSDLEKKLWSRFWDYATDPELAKQEGVRVAQGEAVYAPMRKGDTWTITLQNNGGLNLKLVRAGDRGPMRLESWVRDKPNSN
ncbi:MAG: hypothetical protein GXY44_11545 [Phycisphaerales bacterium]|nr:hypothetical protein [Phycisphaerales bacterium]